MRETETEDGQLIERVRAYIEMVSLAIHWHREAGLLPWPDGSWSDEIADWEVRL